jgi:AcrR family transcriptional regulator
METSGRPNQKMRTRKDLLQAAARLMKQGKKPSLEEIAEEAMVSRATAYRYFPSVEALLLETALDIASPAPDMFAGDESIDPIKRVQRADAAMHDMVLAQETTMRLFLANALERSVHAASQDAEAPPLRQNRRTPLIEAALAPAKKQFAPKDYDRLGKALALVIGTEAQIVCKDVLRLQDKEARAVKAWAIAALIEAAQKIKGA